MNRTAALDPGCSVPSSPAPRRCSRQQDGITVREPLQTTFATKSATAGLMHASTQVRAHQAMNTIIIYQRAFSKRAASRFSTSGDISFVRRVTQQPTRASVVIWTREDEHC